MSNDLVLKTFPSPVLIAGGARFRAAWRMLPWVLFGVGLFIARLMFWKHAVASGGVSSAAAMMLLLWAGALSFVMSLAAVSYYLFTSTLPAHYPALDPGVQTVSWKLFYVFDVAVCAASIGWLFVGHGGFSAA